LQHLRVILDLDATYPVTSVALSNQGNFAVTGGTDDKAILWNLESGNIIRVFEGHGGTLSSVAISFCQ